MRLKPDLKENSTLPEVNQQAIDWLFKLRAEDISPEEMHEFAEWLSQDSSHAFALGEAEDMFDTMIVAANGLRQKQGQDQPKPKPVIEENIHSAINDYRGAVVNVHNSSNRFRYWLTVPIALAAAWLLAVLSIMPNQAHLLDTYLSDYHTGTGEQRDIALNDGSHLLLNTNSAVSVDYQNDLRLITLRHGQVRFTVAKEPQRAFEVKSGGLTIRALGTVFEVYNPENDTVRVAVQEHAVSATLSTAQLSETDSTVIIKEGQQLNYQGDSQLPTPVTANLSQIGAWSQQKLFVNDQPLKEVIAELNRYRNGRIFIHDATLNNQRIMGVFSLANTDEAVHTLSNVLALKETRMGLWWVLLHR
ncbi:MAG: FecR domain-containing protein [Methylococcales bacterium]|nr:FecR domain-containing protein [Methylococcales bacterium]